MAFGIVTASHSDEERTLIDAPSGSNSGSEKAFVSKKTSCSESAHFMRSNEATAFGSGSLGATHLDVFARHALSHEAHSSESALATQDDVLALVADEPNQWCVDG